MSVRAQAVETEFSKNLQRWSSDLDVLRQNWLLNESAFMSFACDRGVGISGVVKGEPSEFHACGWLSADGRAGRDFLFHPFRIHVLHHLVSATKRRIPVRAREWNGTADLAILLEPIYWPELTDQIGYGGDYESRLEKYRRRVLKLVRSQDPEIWRRIHNDLRIDAAGMDPNGELYVLLRLSLWERRKELRGQVSGALWIRHMAEVLRRGFEEAHQVQWLEEDQAFGHWSPGARVQLFGLERPFHDRLRSKPFIAYRFGLFTGSALRWYLEGPTEYYAVLKLLSTPPMLGIELMNLKGEIATDQGNAAWKLEDALKQDLALRRFSMISFDRDEKANVRAIRRQIELHHVVGLVNANDPDFEFANFSLHELVEIAALMDERLGFNGERVRKAEWKGVTGGKAFEERYRRASERRRCLKGQAWGEALAEYAVEHPVDPRTGAERPLLRVALAACWAWHSNYDFQREHVTFDPQTFKVKRQ